MCKRKLEETSKNRKECEKTLEEVNQSCEHTNNKIKDLNERIDDLQTRLERSENLIEELAKEKVRWQELESVLETKLSKLEGDCLISSAFLSYAGVFPNN